MSEKIDIGPRDFAEQPGSPFLLSKSEWLAIQTYVNNGINLPINDEKMRHRLGLPDGASVSEFDQLIAAYKEINSHVTVWRDDTFPETVNLSSDMVHYATKAKTYYGALDDPIAKLIANPDDEQAKLLIKGITDSLASDADKFALKANDVVEKIHAFRTETETDNETVTTLVPFYEEKYGKTGEESKELQREIEAQQIVLDAANSEYDHDVIVAATTPTYAWIFPAGTIAAAVVAGVYGDKAVKALKRARDAQEKINALSETIARNTNLLISITGASKGLVEVKGQISAALPVIQKIEGIWTSLSSDLTDIGELVINDIQKAIPILKNLGVTTALEKWEIVKREANEYRVNAFITVTGDPSEEQAQNVVNISSALLKQRTETAA